MKKTYISPELIIQLVHTEKIIALSKTENEADPNKDALVKDEFEGEGGNGYRTTTVEWENWEDQEEQQ